MHRKGASIYIGAVLLVVITVTAGIFFGKWYLRNVREEARSNEEMFRAASYCSQILLNVDNVSFNVSGNNKLFMYVENTGNVNAKIIGLKAYDVEGNEQEVDVDLFLAPYDKKPLTVTLSVTSPLHEIRLLVDGCQALTVSSEYIQQ